MWIVDNVNSLQIYNGLWKQKTAEVAEFCILYFWICVHGMSVVVYIQVHICFCVSVDVVVEIYLDN